MGHHFRRRAGALGDTHDKMGRGRNSARLDSSRDQHVGTVGIRATGEEKSEAARKCEAYMAVLHLFLGGVTRGPVGSGQANPWPP